MSRNKKTTISFEYDGDKYKLEFTADSLKKMQKMGFNFGDVESQIITFSEDAFCGAFIANHQTVPRKKRIDIYHEMCATEEDGKQELDDIIMEMMNEAIEEINQKQGNIKWKVEK